MFKKSVPKSVKKVSQKVLKKENNLQPAGVAWQTMFPSPSEAPTAETVFFLLDLCGTFFVSSSEINVDLC